MASGTLFGSDHCKYIHKLIGVSFFFYFSILRSGKMARLSSLSSSQSVSFRHGTNVEFNSPGFQPPGNGPLPTGTIDGGVAPMEGYNLQAISQKSRDFSNPMYDAVQSGTTVDPTVGNGSGKLIN